MTTEEAEKICDKAAEEVGEYLDAVLVIGTFVEGKETSRVFAKSGNWFTCVGLAHDFLSACNQEDLAARIAEVLHKEGWDGDD